MSNFDNMFSYQVVEDFYQQRLTELQAENANITAEIILLGSVSGTLSENANIEIDYLSTKKLCNTDSISRIGNVVASIDEIQSLGSNDKNVLVDFYTTYGQHICRKQDWMRKLLDNVPEIVVESNTLLTGNLSPQEGNCKARLLWQKCKTKEYTAAFIQLLK